MRYPYDGKRQIKIAQPIQLGTNTRNAGGSAAPQFRVMMPDSRLQAKISVLYVPAPPVALPYDISGMTPTLYLAEEDECYSGEFSGFVPLTAIIPGTSPGAPQALPVDASLLGYSREFVTAADAIRGVLEYNSTAAPGAWFLQVRWQPYGQRLPDEDWAETEQLCNAALVGTAGKL